MYFLGQPIVVPMTQFIIAQVIGLGVLAFDFISFQQKDQRKYFGYTAMSSLLWVTMFALVGAQIPILLVSAVSTIRNIIFWWALRKDTGKARMIARRTVYTSLAVALIAAIPAIIGTRPGTRGLQVLLLIGTLAFVVGQYMPGIWMLRISAVIYAITVGLVNSPLDTFNPVGLIIEANKILAVIIFFAIYFRKEKERARMAAIKPVALSLGRDLRTDIGLAA